MKKLLDLWKNLFLKYFDINQNGKLDLFELSIIISRIPPNPSCIVCILLLAIIDNILLLTLSVGFIFIDII